MRTFIVRPFGTKEGIDFDRVESLLIKPALRSTLAAPPPDGPIFCWCQGSDRTGIGNW